MRQVSFVTHASIFLRNGSSERAVACERLAAGIDYAYF
jgi:hypothetical protein